MTIYELILVIIALNFMFIFGTAFGFVLAGMNRDAKAEEKDD